MTIEVLPKTVQQPINSFLGGRVMDFHHIILRKTSGSTWESSQVFEALRGRDPSFDKTNAKYPQKAPTKLPPFQVENKSATVELYYNLSMSSMRRLGKTAPATKGRRIILVYTKIQAKLSATFLSSLVCCAEIFSLVVLSD